MKIDETNIFAYLAVAVAIQIGIIWAAVQLATAEIRKNQRIQNELLAQLARKAGASEEEIVACWKVQEEIKSAS